MEFNVFAEEFIPESIATKDVAPERKIPTIWGPPRPEDVASVHAKKSKKTISKENPEANALRRHVLSFNDPDVVTKHSIGDMVIVEEIINTISHLITKKNMSSESYSIRIITLDPSNPVKINLYYIKSSKIPYKVHYKDFKHKINTISEYHKFNFKLMLNINYNFNENLITKSTYYYKSGETIIEDYEMKTQKLLRAQIYNSRTGFTPVTL